MDMWTYLRHSRPVGFGGVGGVPLSEIMTCLALFEIVDVDDRETCVKMIQALDSVYLEHVNPKPEGKPPESSPSKGNGRRK